jgi:hypothetical protein
VDWELGAGQVERAEAVSCHTRWDLETTPDLDAAARMLGLEGAPDKEFRAALGSGFAKHPLHKMASGPRQS